MSDTPVQRVLAALDSLDVDAFTAQFAPDVRLALAYGQRATGLEQASNVVASFFAELRGTHHEVSSVWNPEADVWIAEMSATYELSDHSQRGPYTRIIVLRTAGDRIEELRFYGGNEPPLSEDGHPYQEVRGPHGWLPTL